MSELIVLAFQTEDGAHEMGGTIKQLQKAQLINITDAATVVRRQDGKVKVKQATNLVGAGALGGAFWGMFIGLLFFMPWLGLAVGAVTGAISGKMTDYGIDDDFINEVGEQVEPGGSALFLLIEDWTEDKVLDELGDYKAQVIRTSLSKDDEEKLKAAFGASEE